MPDIAFVNNVFMPLSEAHVSVEDRGFQFGDGVYELLRVYAGVPFRPAQHVARLGHSAAALGISLPHDPARWTALISEAVTRSGYPSAKVYIQVTRGAAPREHALREALTPTVVMTVRALGPSDDALYAAGATAVTVADIRWGRCDIKSVCLLANVLAKQQAQQAGAAEALFIRDGCVWEGSTSNLMIVQKGLLTTPAEGPWLLSGITRQEVLALARTAGIPVKEQRVTEAELFAAEEAFLTGTTIEVLPVVAVNGRSIGTAKPGPITRLLMARFGEAHP
jgi:D-alanine transaminase